MKMPLLLKKLFTWLNTPVSQLDPIVTQPQPQPEQPPIASLAHLFATAEWILQLNYVNPALKKQAPELYVGLVQTIFDVLVRGADEMFVRRCLAEAVNAVAGTTTEQILSIERDHPEIEVLERYTKVIKQLFRESVWRHTSKGVS